MTFVESTASDSVARLSARPPISAPRKSLRPAEPSQPVLGLLGLLLVVPIAVALAISAGDDGSTRGNRPCGCQKRRTRHATVRM